MKPFLFFLFVFASFGLIFPSNALACACCSDAGTYFTWTGKASEYDLEILSNIKFANAASLFFTEGDIPQMKGLSALEKDMETQTWLAAEADFDITSLFAAKTWKFNFKTPTGKTGMLALPMPAQMLQFKVDIHDGSDRGLGPLLYKEWRFRGTVASGTGIFKPGIISPTKYFLVLQGRGRGCDDVLDFTHWRLEISGKRAGYAIYGKLTSGDDSLPAETTGQN